MNFLVLFIALSISLPMAWVSIGKVLALFAALIAIGRNAANKKSVGPNFRRKPSTFLALSAISLFGLGIFWSSAPMDIALLAFVKHSKIILIAIIGFLVSNMSSGKIILRAWMTGQCFVLASSYLMAIGISLPWAQNSANAFVVFSESYIDQSIMFVFAAAIAWHLRTDGIWPRWLGTALAILFLANVSLLLPGRTGYVLVALALGMATFWSFPKSRVTSLTLSIVIPLALVSTLFLTSEKFQSRVTSTVTEAASYRVVDNATTSAGWRLNAWFRSAQAIYEKPLLGNGTGSWAISVKAKQGENADTVFGSGNSSNPHQEYLLWGVEIGIVGAAIFICLLVCYALEALRFGDPAKRVAFTLLACVATAALFNSVLYDDLIGDFICITLGIIFGYGYTSKDKSYDNQKISGWFRHISQQLRHLYGRLGVKVS